MTDEKTIVKVAIVGLGRVGSAFLEKLSAAGACGVEIVAVADTDESAPGLQAAKDRSIPVHKDLKEICAMGETVDIIFDVSGNADARKELRSEMASTGNKHTAIAPEVNFIMIWNLLTGGATLPAKHRAGY